MAKILSKRKTVLFFSTPKMDVQFLNESFMLFNLQFGCYSAPQIEIFQAV